MHLHELGDVKFGRLESLHLADENVLQRVDVLASLLDLGADRVGDELAHQILKIASGSLLGHDVSHALADRLDLGGLCVGGLLELVLPLLGEGKAEHSQLVTICGRHVNLALDRGLHTYTKKYNLRKPSTYKPLEIPQATPLNQIHTKLF